MDKITKALRKLSPKERERIKEILTRLRAGDILGLDIKKLKTTADIFRIRSGDIRVIYRKEADKIFLLSIERRSEKTYKS